MKTKLADLVIEYSFYLLFFLVPIIWLPVNYELFEFPKMLLTYALTVVITLAWFLKLLWQKEFKFKRTILDLPLLAFLGATLISTIFSLDPHTSIYGYYSRFNGGLLSVIAYTLLYFALVNNFDKKKAQTLLVVGLISGFLVGFYGLLERPNPLFATIENGRKVWHGIDYRYWAEAVEIRIFSTLGQPNWLAAYLAMLLPISLSFMINVKKALEKAIFLLFSIVSFLGISFTLSRGGTFGLIAGLLVYAIFLFIYPSTLKEKLLSFFRFKVGWPESLRKSLFWLAAFVVAVVLINYYFGNAFQLRGSGPASLSSNNSSSTNQTQTPPSNQTQLEVGGTQTGQIRLIVWSGALKIFEHYPLTGTGVETFGYSYYLFRPVAHNLTSEWDFLYNKAHNEYLNYLANQGILGLATYLILIVFFIFWSLRYLIMQPASQARFLVLALLASYVGFLIQNIFGFSVVIIAIFFFLFPALAFILTDSFVEKPLFNPKIRSQLSQINVNRLFQVIFVIGGLYCLLFIARMWLADTYYAQSGSSDDSTNYQNLKTASEIMPSEPLYRSELANSAATLASEVDDQALENKLIDEAEKTSKQLFQEHPHNTTIVRNRLQTVFTLSQIDKKYTDETIDAAEKLGNLAPTDASIQYNLALIYALSNEKDRALTQLDKVLKLKADYQDAKDLQTKLRSS